MGTAVDNCEPWNDLICTCPPAQQALLLHLGGSPGPGYHDSLIMIQAVVGKIVVV